MKVSKISKEDAAVNISKAKTIYETTYGLVIAIFLGVIIIVAIGMLIFAKPSGTKNYAGLIASIFGGIFFILQVYSYRKKN
jgi:hypothetical protein